MNYADVVNVLRPGEVKVTSSLCLIKHHAIRTCGGLVVSIHAFFNLGARRRWMVKLTSPLLYLWGESPQYLWIGARVGPKSRSGYGGGKKNTFPAPAETEPRSSSP